MAKDKVKVALIGAGGWGREHARIFQQRGDVEFVAICGRDANKTAARAAAFGVRHYTDIQTMLAREKPDLVSLCLPNQQHYLATLQVIRAGYPLLVEKPFVFVLAKGIRTYIEKACSAISITCVRLSTRKY